MQLVFSWVYTLLPSSVLCAYCILLPTAQTKFLSKLFSLLLERTLLIYHLSRTALSLILQGMGAPTSALGSAHPTDWQDTDGIRGGRILQSSCVKSPWTRFTHCHLNYPTVWTFS